MIQNCDYSALVSQIYEKRRHKPISIREEHLLTAGVVVERTFPPESPRAVFRILTALNLLNAGVKTDVGRNVVTYGYIKGMAARLLLHLAANPVSGVDIYWSLDDRVVYFSVYRVQVSFHYVPYLPELRAYKPLLTSKPQQWSGMQLQAVAVELFRVANRQAMFWNDEEDDCVRRKMLEFRVSATTPPKRRIRIEKPAPMPQKTVLPVLPKTKRGHIARPTYQEDKELSLRKALSFNVWVARQFVLWRRDTRMLTPIARFDGTNHRGLMNLFKGVDQRLAERDRKRMVRGRFYYVSPQREIRALQRSQYLIKLSQWGYLFEGGLCHNLFLTYGIVRYLAVLYPTLKFLCRLDYNRWLERRHFYTRETLYSVPFDSPARWLKVWMVADTDRLLADFDPSLLPQRLIDEYKAAGDVLADFEVTQGVDGLMGILAYGRLQLLPNRYYCIRLRGFFAHVQERKGSLWAIYSLGCECFDTDFIYERIWYDNQRAAILGLVGGEEQVIYRFRYVNRYVHHRISGPPSDVKHHFPPVASMPQHR